MHKIVNAFARTSKSEALARLKEDNMLTEMLFSKLTTKLNDLLKDIDCVDFIGTDLSKVLDMVMDIGVCMTLHFADIDNEKENENPKQKQSRPKKLSLNHLNIFCLCLRVIKYVSEGPIIFQIFQSKISTNHH